MSGAGEPVKPAPEVELAEKIAALALSGSDVKARWRAGILGDHHLTEELERLELELTEVWREYLHALD
jgi:hypothetical protein